MIHVMDIRYLLCILVVLVILFGDIHHFRLAQIVLDIRKPMYVLVNYLIHYNVPIVHKEPIPCMVQHIFREYKPVCLDIHHRHDIQVQHQLKYVHSMITDYHLVNDPGICNWRHDYE